MKTITLNRERLCEAIIYIDNRCAPCAKHFLLTLFNDDYQAIKKFLLENYTKDQLDPDKLSGYPMGEVLEDIEESIQDENNS